MQVPEHVREQAKRNVDLKAAHPNIDDPMKAIEFALDGVGDLDCFDFLETWRDGNWAELVAMWPGYLSTL